MEEKLSLSVYNGRPFSGTGILVRNQMSKFVVPVSTGSPRVTALRLFNVGSQDIVVLLLSIVHRLILICIQINIYNSKIRRSLYKLPCVNVNW